MVSAGMAGNYRPSAPRLHLHLLGEGGGGVDLLLGDQRGDGRWGDSAGVSSSTCALPDLVELNFSSKTATQPSFYPDLCRL